MSHAINQQIKKLLKQGKIEEALNLLPKYLKNTNAQNNAIVQSAIYKRLIENIERNTIDWEKAGVIKNQIIVSILNILSLENNTSNKHENTSTIFSEIDSLKTSISAIPNKDTAIISFLNRQTSLVVVLAVIAIAFGSGIVVTSGNKIYNYINPPVTDASLKKEIELYKTQNDSLVKTTTIEYNNLEKQYSTILRELNQRNTALENCKAQNEKLEKNNTKPNIAIANNTRYSSGVSYIHLHKQKGNTFTFLGHISQYSSTKEYGVQGKATLKGNDLYLKGDNIKGTLTLSGNKLFGLVIVEGDSRDVNLIKKN